MRGRKIDMGALAAANADKIAVGNAKITARGDVLGSNGVVLRTQEQVEAEWARNQQRQNEVIGISNNIKMPLPPDQTRVKVVTEDQNFDPSTIDITSQDPVDNATQVKKIVQQRRKIVDAD